MITQPVSEDQLYQAAADQQLMDAATGGDIAAATQQNDGTVAASTAQSATVASQAVALAASGAQQDILQQAFEESGAGGEAANNAEPELTPGELVEQAVAQVHDGEPDTHEGAASSEAFPSTGGTGAGSTAPAVALGAAPGPTDTGTVVTKQEQQENLPPLGSCDNPIQVN